MDRKQQLAPQLDAYVLRTFGKNFQFRAQQRDVVLDIVDAFFDSTCNLYLLDAPTGSGKSIIAMITAGFLTEFKMKGYILASDLALQTQYERDFFKHNLQWGSIKGVDNYSCAVNLDKFSLGDCRMKNMSYEAAEALPCFPDCAYLVGRKKAINSPVALLNYSFWLIQRNYVEPKMIAKERSVPFAKRDFVFCDEAHKVADIVQNHFSPSLDILTYDKLEKLRSFLKKQGIYVNGTSGRLKTVINSLMKEEDESKIFALLKEFDVMILNFLQPGVQELKAKAGQLYNGDHRIPPEWRYAMGLADWAKDMHCKFEDYTHIISQTGVGAIIKNPQQNGDKVIFNCLDESYMMNRHFHEQGGFKVLMTATMGEPASFLKTIGAKNCRYNRMESTFDYSKSPIYFYPGKRMSLANRETSIPWAAEKIAEILEKHPEESGIIHSGSYDMTLKMHNLLPPELKKRVLVYQGTSEKEKMLEMFLAEKNMVIMGPSILEGLDLLQDKSRFQIFAKVPYPHLGDKFVSAKMNVMPEWYTWKACTAVLQGVGRSIRSKDDWAVTYFLDGCLADLFRNSRQSFPNDFKKRIVLQ